MIKFAQNPRLNRWIPLAFAITVVLVISISTNAEAATSSATVSGIAKVTGTPRGWQDVGFYVQACPASVSYSDGCDHGITATPGGLFNTSPGPYTLELSVGKWKIGAYYYAYCGQLIDNTPTSVTLTAGESVHLNINVAYQTPAAKGVVTLTGAPSNFNSEAYMGVQACPGGEAFAVGCGGGTESYENIGPGAPYTIDLSPGSWNLGAYYRPHTNDAVFAGSPVAIRAKARHTLKVNLTIEYQGL